MKPLTADTKSHSEFQPNMICSFGAILAWKSDDDDTDADADYDDDRKSDPYMSPSYAGDTIKLGLLIIKCLIKVCTSIIRFVWKKHSHWMLRWK